MKKSDSGTETETDEGPRYPSRKAKFITLVGSDYLLHVPGREEVHLPGIVEGLDEADVVEVLMRGAQLGDLVGHLIHHKGCFSVIIPRDLIPFVRATADAIGRGHEVWDCSPCEDPRCVWARAEFPRFEDPLPRGRAG